MKSKQKIVSVLLLLALLLLASCHGSTTPAESTESGHTDKEPSTSAPETGTDTPEPGTVFPIIQSGKSVVRIIRAAEADEDIRNAAIDLHDKIEKQTGVTVEISDDGQYRDSEYEIVLGRTAYPESKTAYAGWCYNEYGYRVIGRKLTVGGHLTGSTQSAVNQLWFAIRKNATEDTMSLSDCSPKTNQAAKFFTGFPAYRGGTVAGVFDCADNTMEVLLSETDGAAFDAFRTDMTAAGFGVFAENRIGDNRFVTYVSDAGVVHSNYCPAEGTVRLYASHRAETVLPVNETKPGTAIAEPTLGVIGVSTGVEGNGMCMVLTLPDGRFLVWDGGFASSAERLLDYLRANNKRAGKPVIAAWILTHSHGDHYECFSYFSGRYAQEVTVEYILANGGTRTMFREGLEGWDTYLTGAFRQDAAKFDGAKVVKPHAGQKFSFSGVELEILFTHEELYPTKVWDINESSTVTRVSVQGQTVLFTGDALNNATDDMEKRYGAALQSDILQVNHHGSYDKMKASFYETVRPTVAIFPTSSVAFADYRTHGMNQALLAIVREWIVTDDQLWILPLPYQAKA